jgi:hypothetical protein
VRGELQILQEEGPEPCTRGSSQPSRKGQAEYFTDAVRIDPLFQAPDPAHVGGASVTFDPGAPAPSAIPIPIGQTLIIMRGSRFAIA